MINSVIDSIGTVGAGENDEDFDEIIASLSSANVEEEDWLEDAEEDYEDYEGYEEEEVDIEEVEETENEAKAGGVAEETVIAQVD